MSDVNLQTGGFCGYSFGKESLALKNPPSLLHGGTTSVCVGAKTHNAMAEHIRHFLTHLNRPLTNMCPAGPSL